MSLLTEQITTALTSAVNAQKELEKNKPAFFNSFVQLPPSILTDQEIFKEAKKFVSASKRTIEKEDGSTYEATIHLHSVVSEKYPDRCSWITTCWAKPPRGFTAWSFSSKEDDSSVASSNEEISSSKRSAFTQFRSSSKVDDVASLLSRIAVLEAEVTELREFKASIAKLVNA